ncbi:MAG TPA: DEAD/DEAH box helicase family protein [Frankiaceae bacterium]|nr:DEAD/DEAH box helicase family protein [Frankiaceae bacterium]
MSAANVLSEVPHGGRRLRAWQSAALAAYSAAGPSDYLLHATPGAGKTSFALTVAADLVASRLIDRVVVVCPTDHLRHQWALAAAAAGLALDANLPNSVGPVRADVVGYVTTYAQVAQKPLLHRRRVEGKRTLAILDEVHHAGDGLSWGEAAAEAFEPARRRLCLTGTPFRSRADERIPFVSYESAPTDDGQPGLRSVPDFSYGYRQALADGVVRPVVFAAYTGTSRWRTSAGEVVAASLSEPLTAAMEAQAWRTALDPGGRWVPHVIAAMDDRVSQLRESGQADAAGLVLASDQETARAYAKIAKDVTGEKPYLITSDDPKASAKIAEFTHSTARLAVCVRMISEGVDIPRAACLAWLTSYRTPLFFAQAVGRVVRARRPGETATVYLPAVRPLLTLAADLESERDRVVRLRSVDDQGEFDELGEVERLTGLNEWEAIDAEASFAHVLAGGRAVTAESVGSEPVDDLDDGGLPGLLTPEQTAALLARRDQELHKRLRAARAEQPEADPSEVSWQDAGPLRREVNALVARVAAASGMPHAIVHAQVRQAVPGPASSAATADLLARRRDHLLERVGGATRNL